MAVGIDMFGDGGEGLGGLFVGNQMAMDRDKAEMAQQESLANIAAQQARTQGLNLSNQYEEAVLGDKIQAYKDEATKKKEDLQLEKFNATGEKFGRLSQMIRQVPGPARQAALRQMAGQAGIGEDNPLFQQFMSADPEALPDIMDNFSKGFYEAGSKARGEAQQRELMLQQKKAELAAKAEEGRLNREQKAELNRENNQRMRDIAGMVQAGANQRAAAASAKGGKGSKDPLMNLTTDKAISYLELKKAAEGELSASEEQALVNLKQFKLNQATVGKEETTADIMGTRKPLERAEAAAKGPQTKAGAAGGTGKPQVGEVRKGYTYKGGDPSKPTSWEKVK